MEEFESLKQLHDPWVPAVYNATEATWSIDANGARLFMSAYQQPRSDNEVAQRSNMQFEQLDIQPLSSYKASNHSDNPKTTSPSQNSKEFQKITLPGTHRPLSPIKTPPDKTQRSKNAYQSPYQQKLDSSRKTLIN